MKAKSFPPKQRLSRNTEPQRICKAFSLRYLCAFARLRAAFSFSQKFLTVIIALLVISSSLHAQQAVQIVSATPKGKTSSAAEAQRIVVTFNQPMIALKGLSEPMSSGPFTIMPNVAGTFRWLGTSSIEFQPSAPLPAATKFTVTIAAGLKSIANTTLSQPYSWSFETMRPAVVQTWPENEAQHIHPEAEILLRFNLPVNANAIANFITFTTGKQTVRTVRGVPIPMTTTRLPIQIRHATTEDLKDLSDWQKTLEQVVVIKPQTALPLGEQINVTVLANMPATVGNLGTGAPFTLKFFTAEGFAFKDYEPKSPTPPLTNMTFHFSNPVAAADLVQHLKFNPPIEYPEYYNEWNWYEAELHLSFYFPPDTTITFTIDADLPDQFGNKLGKVATGKITTTGYEPEVRFSGGTGIVEADGDRRVPIEGMNYEGANLGMRKLARNEIVPLLNDQNAFYGRQAPPFPLTVQQRLSFGKKRNFWNLRPIELKHALGADSTGTVFVQVDASRANSPRFIRGLYQVTHLGLTAKFSPRNNLVFVTNMKDASPVANAKIEVRDDGNQILWSGATDAQGRCETPGWAELNMAQKSKWNQPRTWIFAHKGNDLAFLHSEWGTGIYPYRFGIDYEWNPQPLVRTGVVMTDRGLYRTGETVYFKGIMREKDGTGEWRCPVKRDWQWRIEDPRNQEVVAKMIYLSEYGAFDDSLVIDKNAPLGLYWMTLGAAKQPGSDGDGNITSGSFRVEAFRPAEFEVNAFATNLTNAKRGYISGESVTAKIAGRYLFGSPMRNAEIKWRLQLMPSQFNSENFSDYTFRQWRGWYDSYEYHSSQMLASGADSLNAEGEITIKGTAIPSGIPVPQSLLIEGEATSPSGQTLAGRTSVAVHPAEFYIGLRTSGYFFAVNKAVACSVITVTPDDRFANNQRVKLRVIQRQWHSVRKAGVGWRYSWETTVQDTPVDSTMITSANKASAYLFTPKNSGYYIVEASGSDTRGRTTRSAIFFYVSGADYVAWERGDDDRIELIPDRKRYKPGDVATIMVQSPFEKCRALLTIERESIFESRVLELTGTAPTIQIPIKENYLPNMFVSVALLTGRAGNQMFSKEGEDIGKPQFKIGYTNLTVDPGTRHLAVNVKSDRSDYRPGEMVRVSVDVKGPSNQGMESEVTLAVVDVGVLNLIGYKLPDPFADFYGPRPLSVRTSETLLHLIEQRNYGQKAEATGGGGGMFAGIETRSDFRLTPLWLPALRTDANGHAEAQFKLPSNLTTFRIMAVAHTKQSHFGEGNNDFKVNKPLLMQAALPRFTRTGDRFEAGVAITNTTAQRGKVSLQLLAKGVKALGDSLTNFELAPGESRAIRKPFVAGVIGQAKYEFRARMQAGAEDFTDGLAVSIPIMMPQTKEVVATSGSTEERTKEMLNVPGEIYADAGGLELTAASTAMVGLRESVNYLFEYPYGCLEQRLSRALPMILAGDLVDAFKLQALKDGTDYRSVAQASLDEIPRYQTEDGGFALWAGQSRSWDYISALTLYTLARAKQNNFEVNKKLFEAAKKYANEQLRREFGASERMSERSFHYTRALLLHALVLSGEKPEDYLTYLFENREKLSLDGQCHVLRTAFLLKKTPMVTTLQAELMNKVKVDPTMAHFEDVNPQELWWCYYSTARTTALCLQALVETRAAFPMAENVVKWLMAEREMGRWRTTQENSVVFEALTTYFRAYEKDVPSFSAEIRVAGEKILSEAFQGRTTDVRRTESALNRFAQQKDLPVEISKRGPGRFYYGMRMTYFPLKPGPSRDEGITIKKEIQRLATTNGVSAAYHPGEVVQIVLRVIVPQERHFVVVDDPLPAGFEAINPRLLTSSTEYRDYQSEGEEYSWWRYGFDHVEKRDDRVLLFATWLSAGEHVYTPEVFGRFEGSVVEVK